MNIFRRLQNAFFLGRLIVATPNPDPRHFWGSNIELSVPCFPFSKLQPTAKLCIHVYSFFGLIQTKAQY